MATTQKDLVVTLKRETVLNVEILSKVCAMPSELARQIFKDNALERPTQNLFNHLSYYLVAIIDNQASNALPWPLYDTKTEREYRNKVSSFISEYSSKGLLSPVMSSYLVNPGCYKVTVLMFQMSQLAVKRVLIVKMSRNSQRTRYNEATEKYKAKDRSFIEFVDKEGNKMSKRLYVHSHKREIVVQIANLFKKRINEVEKKLKDINSQKYIDNMVDSFLKKYTVDENTKNEIIKIKNVTASSSFFDEWLLTVDNSVSEMESHWNKKMNPFIELSKNTRNNSELLIARSTGEADKNSYMLEYNPRTDYICTKDLQTQVNSQQKYILKNIVKDDKLIFPNLMRSYLIAIGFVLKNMEIDDEIYKFNEYLEGGSRNFKEIVSAMKALLERVMNADARLQPRKIIYDQSISLTKEFSEIPPLPDLADLKANRDQPQLMFDTFTPLNMSKHQFNLHRRTTIFAKPQPRSLITSMYQGPRDDFLKSLISCRISTYDRPNTTQNLNISVISQARNNETIAECSSGFTKQQIMRLLSTKKSSSSKKFKYKAERPNIQVKKGGLFNESHISSNSNGLYRSYSSPNLFENREKRSRTGKKFSMVQEGSLLEVSGITAIDKDSFGTPDSIQFECSRKLLDATSLPLISVSPPPDKATILNNVETVPHKVQFADVNLPKMQENIEKEDSKTETPKTNTHLIRKTSSLEKIINRFKKVRANIVPSERTEDNEFRTIVEEKENLNTVNVDITANRILLPDLLSPSCSAIMKNSSDYLDQVCMDMDDMVRRKPRESLGTALGVDQTFLDQFELID